MVHRSGSGSAPGCGLLFTPDAAPGETAVLGGREVTNGDRWRRQQRFEPGRLPDCPRLHAHKWQSRCWADVDLPPRTVHVDPAPTPDREPLKFKERVGVRPNPFLLQTGTLCRPICRNRFASPMTARMSTRRFWLQQSSSSVEQIGFVAPRLALSMRDDATPRCSQGLAHSAGAPLGEVGIVVFVPARVGVSHDSDGLDLRIALDRRRGRVEERHRDRLDFRAVGLEIDGHQLRQSRRRGHQLRDDLRRRSRLCLERLAGDVAFRVHLRRRHRARLDVNSDVDSPGFVTVVSFPASLSTLTGADLQLGRLPLPPTPSPPARRARRPSPTTSEAIFVSA